MSARDKRVERIQTRVIFTVPFFAPGVAKLPVSFDETVQTACTDGERIRWNPAFFDGLSDGQALTVLCHETAHCLLGHLWRAPENCDWDTWNQATDHAVNLMLKEFGALVQQKGLADPFPFLEPADAYCANPAFAGMAEELIYSRLYSPKPKSPKGKSGSGQGSGSGSGKGGGKPAPGSMPSFGQIEAPAKPDAAKAKQAASDWQATMLQSAKLAQGQGTVPGCIERFVDGIVNPAVNWWDLLRSWLREQCSDDWNWLAPAMEYEGSGFILPSLKSDRVGPVVFATDTSGSIDETMLKQFQAEKQNCLDELRPSRLVDIYCDSTIHAVHEYTTGEVIARKCPGGGGTDFRPVFEHIAKLPERVKALVYLTDLYGSFPEPAPDIPTIWVTWSKGMEAPFGMTVYAGQA